MHYYCFHVDNTTANDERFINSTCKHCRQLLVILYHNRRTGHKIRGEGGGGGFHLGANILHDEYASLVHSWLMRDPPTTLVDYHFC